MKDRPRDVPDDAESCFRTWAKMHGLEVQKTMDRTLIAWLVDDFPMKPPSAIKAMWPIGPEQQVWISGAPGFYTTSSELFDCEPQIDSG